MIVVGILLFYVIPALLLAEVVRCVYLEMRRDRIPILLYHRLISRAEVEAGRIPDHEPIYASYDDTFAAQMRYLVEGGYTSLSLDEMLKIRRGMAPLPSKSLIITFDDGYESNFTLAWPALRRHGLKATIFVAPHPNEYTRRLVTGFDGFLSEEQMREMDRGGVAIESHSLTHCILTELDDAAARFELSESKRVLSGILGRQVRHLAIPRSGYDARVRRLAIDEGYETISCNRKGSSTGWSDLHALPRIVIERDMTRDDFARALEPRTAVMLRLLGHLKRLPALLFGPSAAARIRRILLSSPLAGLIDTRRLKRILGASAIVYLLGIFVFTWYLVGR